MISSKERDKNIIAQILEYCNHIDECFLQFGNNYKKYLSNVVFRDALSMPLFQIQELSLHLSDEFKEKYKNEIPWQKLRGMRNLFAHDYFNMDIETIWKTATKDIPILRKFCEEQFKAFEKTDD
ncbi:MAG: DUF86 domain-containing protein [Oscillospiraceae bacterium]|nr:DUF86 domain-containing protein [Oscillospiraceae bacterium]